MSEDLAIEAQGVRKVYGPTVAVDGLSLRVRRGEIYGLIGPDGAGKTTSLRLLGGLLAADAGRARVLGIDVFQQPERVKERIGYMAQQFNLYGDLTVDENLRFFADLQQVPRQEGEERARRLLAFSRLEPYRQRLAEHLSGGMKKKLALSCALIHQPELLLLDEPTTGVDPVSRREFWGILYGLLRQGVTILVSTPYMDEAERCNTVAFVSGGQVLLAGPPEALKARTRHRILEVWAQPRATAQRLAGLLPGVVGAQPFGETLHLVVDDPELATASVLKELPAQGVQVQGVRQVPPSIEDVFFELVARP